MDCVACGERLPEGARFCPACGQAQSPRSYDERRVVTVLFADVVGFTTFAEQLDPEQVKRLLDLAFERLTEVIESFGGRVDKVMGDAVIALFGAPVAHEDDAERAVRAGLRMHEELAELAAATPGFEDVQLRVGINTGEVLVGTIAGKDYTAMGDTVNTAARLQALALPGGVLVGEATRLLCSDAVRFEELAPTQLRGRQQVERPWRVVGIETEHRRRRVRPAAPFIGRPAERALLQSAIDTVGRGRSALVAVIGEAGIGKSRLVEETLDAVRADRPDVLVLDGACSPFGDGNVWAPIAASIEELLCTSIDDEQECQVLAHLQGAPSELDRLDPAGVRSVLFGTVVRALRRRAGEGPVVVWIDDLQWAHQLLLDLLELVVRSTVGLPVLVITALRPDAEPRAGVEAWPPVVERLVSVQIPLGPLDEDEAGELVDLLTTGRVPLGLRNDIIERAGGNPLFLTELALLALGRSTGAQPSVLDPELPGSLRALIASRLDQLGPEERMVIDNAAVIGSEGPVDGLAQFASELHQPFHRAALDALVAAGLLDLHAGWWRFRSDVVREVAYLTVTKQDRVFRHAGIARVLARAVDGEPDAQPSLLLERLAHHTAAAAELIGELGEVDGVESDLRERAVQLLARAASRSYELGGFRHGAELAGRALALAGDDPVVRRALLLVHSIGLVDLRALDQASVELDEALTLARQAGNRVDEGEALRLLGIVSRRRGDLPAARERLGSAVDIFRSIDDPVRLAPALRARGFAEVFGGSLADASWYLGEADALYEQQGDELGRAWVAQHRAWVAFLSGDNDAAEHLLRRAAEVCEAHRDQVGVRWSRGMLAYVRFFQRRMDESADLATEVLDEARQWGDEWSAGMMLTLLGNHRLWAGRFGEAVHLAEQASAGFRRVSDPFGMVQASACLARARVALGRSADAERALEEILAVADASVGLALPFAAAAGVAMHAGEGERAVRLAERAISRMAVTGIRLPDAVVQESLGHLQAGRADDALAVLETLRIPPSPPPTASTGSLDGAVSPDGAVSIDGGVSVDGAVPTFALAVRALCWAALGDLDSALADAERMLAAPGTSYFDRALALAAAASAARRRGDADAEFRIDELVAVASSTADVVVGAFVRSVAGRLRGAPAVGERLHPGWLRVVIAITGEPALSPAPVGDAPVGAPSGG